MRKTFWAVVLSLSACEQRPEPAVDVTELERSLQQAETTALNRSSELVRLRQRVAALESENAQLKEQLSLRAPASDEVPVGPRDPMVGFISAIAHNFGFAIISLDKMGPKDEPKEGFKFDIVRGSTKVAVAEAVKVKSKNANGLPSIEVRIIAGKKEEVRQGDMAIAIRSITVEKPEVDAKVTGKMGESTFQINIGRGKGLRIGDEVHAYRDNRRVGAMEIVHSDLESAIAKWIVEENLKEEIRIGDEVRIETTSVKRREIFGKIINHGREIVADFGSRAGARPGQKYSVHRDGKPVGTLRLRDAGYDVSFFDPADATPREAVKTGDFLELVKD
jgi:hypothetical protein